MVQITKKRGKSPPTTPAWVIPTLIAIAVLTYLTLPDPFSPPPGDEPTINHVFYYGWLTALSTGLGAVPFFVLRGVADFWVGISNAIAAGMMIAASYSLFMEGATFDDPMDSLASSDEMSLISGTIVRTVIGSALGLLFILATKNFMDQHEDLKVGGLVNDGNGAGARKALLIFLVMTVHSFSEGVGIGVSFGGQHGSQLGMVISASLAVHNIPEGLAIAVVVIPQGASVLTAMVWAIATSLPQPVMAVPAYMFVHHFIPLLPVGLGFAGGAMAWVAFCELLMEAIEETNILTTAVVSLSSLTGMLYIQGIIEENA